MFATSLISYHPRLVVDVCLQIGSDKTFDPVVYSSALMANRQQQAESTQRNFVGSGKILEFKPNGH